MGYSRPQKKSTGLRRRGVVAAAGGQRRLVAAAEAGCAAAAEAAVLGGGARAAPSRRCNRSRRRRRRSSSRRRPRAPRPVEAGLLKEHVAQICPLRSNFDGNYDGCFFFGCPILPPEQPKSAACGEQVNTTLARGRTSNYRKK